VGLGGQPGSLKDPRDLSSSTPPRRRTGGTAVNWGTRRGKEARFSLSAGEGGPLTPFAHECPYQVDAPPDV
jgi:hypothetical protein